MRRHVAIPDRPQMTIWCMSIACGITKATNTDSLYIATILSRVGVGL